MTDITITEDMNLETAITTLGLTNGGKITINDGAFVTMTQTNSVLIGDITLLDGEFFIDGDNISDGSNSITFVGSGGTSATDKDMNIRGRGTLTAKGDWFNIGTTDGTDYQEIDLSSANNVQSLWKDDKFISYLPMIQVETGRRINYKNSVGVAPKIGDWVRFKSNHSAMGKIKSVGADYVVVWAWYGRGVDIVDGDELIIRSIQDDKGSKLVKSWSANADGADIKEDGVYTEWGNCRQADVEYLDKFNNGVGGMVFDYAAHKTTLKFGTKSLGSLGGFVPPSGCNIRVANVMFASATPDDFDLGLTTSTATVNENDYYSLSTSYGGAVYLDTVNFCNFVAYSYQASNFKAQYCGATLVFGSSVSGNKTEYRHCVVVNDPQVNTAPSSYSAFQMVENSQGVEVEFCMVVSSTTTRAMFTALTCTDAVIKDCISTSIDFKTQQTGTVRCYYLSQCNGVEFNNNVSISNYAFPYQSDSNSDITFTNFQFTRTQDETQHPDENDTFIIDNTTDCTHIGIEMLGNGIGGNHMFGVRDSKNLKFRGFGMIDDKIDFGTTDAELMFNVTGVCSDISIARMWKTDGINGSFINTGVSCKNVVVENCSGDYNSSNLPLGGQGVVFKGIHGSNLAYGANLRASYGLNFSDQFGSDTVGRISCDFTTPQNINPEFSSSSSNIVFSNDGQMDMLKGDECVMTQSYYAKGHTSFSGVTLLALTYGSYLDDRISDIDVFFQYDIESNETGFNGTWLDIRDNTNLESIVGDIESGIRFKYKLVCNEESTISSIYIHSTTSLEAQDNNLYPIDQFEATLTLTSIKDGSDVVILESGTNNVLASVDSGSTSFEYTYNSIHTIDIGVIKQGYVTIYQYNIPVGVTDASIQMFQIVDRNYA